MTIIAFVLIAAGATVARVTATTDQPAGDVPWRTLAVNTLGAFLLGLLLTSRGQPQSIVWTVAGLGSLTTFSTVAAEIASLLDDGQRRQAILYLGLTLVVGIAAARLGLELGARL